MLAKLLTYYSLNYAGTLGAGLELRRLVFAWTVTYGTAHLQGNLCSRDTREFLASCSRVTCVLPSSFFRVTLESHAMNRPTINRSQEIFLLLGV